MIEDLYIDFDKCTDKLNEALTKTIEIAREKRHEFITPELLLYCISLQDEFIHFCNDKGIDVTSLRNELKNYLDELDTIPKGQEYEGLMSANFIKLVTNTHITCDENSDACEDEDDTDILQDIDLFGVNVPMIVAQCHCLDGSFANYVIGKYFDDDIERWYIDLSYFYILDIKDAFQKRKEELTSHDDTFPDRNDAGNEDYGTLLSSMMAGINHFMKATGEHYESNQGQDNNMAPWKAFVTNLNDLYRQKNPLIGREQELTRAIRILCRKDKNNPLFVGEPGVGKTALIYGLARMIDEGQVPSWLKEHTIYALDMCDIMAGASYHGEFEKRMKMVLEGAKSQGKCIIYIDEIHNLMNAGGGHDAMNAAEMLKPYLEDGSLRFIGCTTYQDYNKSIAGKRAIARRFGLIDVKEPTVDETVKIMNGLLPIYEKHHGVTYEPEAVQFAIEQSDALINDRFLPDKAIEIIDEAGAFMQQNPRLNKNGKAMAARFQKVDKALIRQILTDVCRIDAKALASENNDALKDLDKRLCQEIYGQDEAIRQVVRAVMMSKAGLMEPNKPIASLLFVGPTGVGKTEVCKVLARELGIELIRFDMSEYTEKHTISKLIGSPAGYVGYDEGGLLTDAIRKTPNCVLLLDEIEKAHPDIYNILLQVMDYAKLTDNKGNKADFRNVILLMTSNAGAQFAGKASVGFNGGQSKGEAMLGTVQKTFKPEFLNRLSGTVVFHDMDSTMATLILDKKLNQLATRLNAKSVTFTLSDEAHAFLLQKGFTHKYGAREMDRVINQYLSPILMEEILFGKLMHGGKVKIVQRGDGLAID